MRRIRGGKGQQIDQKAIQYRDRKNLTMPKSKIEKSSGPQSYKFYIGPGNNSSLVRRVLSTRKNWQQVDDSKYLFLNLKWQQTNRGYKYDNCIQNRILRQCLNHMQFHHELSNKQYLLKNLSQYCQAHKINVFDIVPVTYVLNLGQSSFDQNQNLFLKFFQHNLPENLKKQDRKHWLSFKRKGTLSSSVQKRNNYYYCKPQLKQVFKTENTQYLWLLKPTSYNRGNGIHIFNQIQTLQSLMSTYLTGYDHNRSNQESSPEIKNKGFRIRQNSSKVLVRTSSFVVQKYLERPLLYAGRKFDIRVWVLFTHDLKVYYFSQGYLRTSSSTYSTSLTTINDINVHLTNNAVQKYAKDYGKFQDNNQLSFRYLQDLVTRAQGDYGQLINQMKYMIKLTALSVRKKINKLDRQWCFQIFGYDFMVDSTCKPWLIQVNTNPCLQQSSLLLQQLLPRMLDDAFCLTIDRMFPPLKSNYSYVLKNQKSTQNLWQLIVDLKK